MHILGFKRPLRKHEDRINKAINSFDAGCTCLSTLASAFGSFALTFSGGEAATSLCSGSLGDFGVFEGVGLISIFLGVSFFAGVL